MWEERVGIVSWMRTVDPTARVVAMPCDGGTGERATELTPGMSSTPTPTPTPTPAVAEATATTGRASVVHEVEQVIAEFCGDDDNGAVDSRVSRLRGLLSGPPRPFHEWNWSEAVHFKKILKGLETETSVLGKSHGASWDSISPPSPPHCTAASAAAALPSLESRGKTPFSSHTPMCGCIRTNSSSEGLQPKGDIVPSKEENKVDATDPSVEVLTPLLDNYTIPISRQGPEYFSSTTQTSRVSLCIIMVGLPARGKTFLAQKICRLLGWHGWRAKVLNVQMAWRRLLLQYKKRSLGEDLLATSSATTGLHLPLKNPTSSCPSMNSETADAAFSCCGAAVGAQTLHSDGDVPDRPEKQLPPPKDGSQQQQQQQQQFCYMNAEHFRALVSDPKSIERRLYRHVLEHYAHDASRFYADGGDVLVVNDDFPTEELRDEAEALFSPLASQTFFMEVIRDSVLNHKFNEMKVKDSMEYPADIDVVDAKLDFVRRVEYLERVYTTLSSTPSSNDPPKDDVALEDNEGIHLSCASRGTRTSTRQRPKRYIKLKNSVEMEVYGVTGYTASRILSYVMNVTQLKVQHPIYFFRHGESLYNLEDRIGGDSELSPDGEKGADELLGFLASLKEHCVAEKAKEMEERGKHAAALDGFGCDSCDHQCGEGNACGCQGIVEIWTSQLRRAVQTVENAEPILGVKTLRWNSLNEIHAGICEDLTYAEVRMQYPLIDQFRRSNKYAFRYPGGESYQDLVMRLEPVIMELENTDRVVVVVAHQAVLRALLAYFGSTSAESCVRLEVPHRTVWRCTYNSKGIALLDELRLGQQ